LFEIKSALGLNFWISKILIKMAHINFKVSHKTVWFAARQTSKTETRLFRDENCELL
jgi:hypothetical protein